MNLPLRLEPNGETPEVDGHNLIDASDQVIGLIEKAEDARAICTAVNGGAYGYSAT